MATIAISSSVVILNADQRLERYDTENGRRLLSRLKRLNALFYSSSPDWMERLSDDELESVENDLENFVRIVRSFIGLERLRQIDLSGLGHIDHEVSRLEAALYAFSRGYAPGQLPTYAEREKLGCQRLALRTLDSVQDSDP